MPQEDDTSAAPAPVGALSQLPLSSMPFDAGMGGLSREEIMRQAREFLDPEAPQRAYRTGLLDTTGGGSTYATNLRNARAARDAVTEKQAELLSRYVPIVQTAAINRQKAQMLQASAWRDALDQSMSTLITKPDLTSEDALNTARALVQQQRVPGQVAAEYLQSLPTEPQALRETLYRQALARTDPYRGVATPKMVKLGEGETALYQSPQTGELTPAGVGSGMKATDLRKLLTEYQNLPPNADPATRQAYQDAIKKATTHPPSAATVILPEKNMLSSFMTELGKSAGASRDAALAAKSSLETAQRLSEILNAPGLALGPLSQPEIVFRRIAEAGNFGGKTNRERLANTQAAIQAMAQLELDAAAQMKGQGAITENERELLKRAASGNQNMSVEELRVIAAVSQRNSLRRIQRYNDYASKLVKMPQLEGINPELITVDVNGQIPTSSPQQPPGLVQFDSNGRPIR